MSCQKNAQKVTQAAGQSGLAGQNSQQALHTGTAQATKKQKASAVLAGLNAAGQTLLKQSPVYRHAQRTVTNSVRFLRFGGRVIAGGGLLAGQLGAKVVQGHPLVRILSRAGKAGVGAYKARLKQ